MCSINCTVVQSGDRPTTMDSVQLEGNHIPERLPGYQKPGSFTQISYKKMGLDFSEEQKAEFQSAKELKTISAPNDLVRYYTLEHLKSIFWDQQRIEDSISYEYGKIKSAKPIDLKGVAIEGTPKNGVIYSAMQVFEFEDNITLGLTETDYIGTGDAIRMVEEMINTDINGYPGVISYRQSEDEGSLILLSWVTPAILRKISLAGKNVKRNHLEITLQLARSIEN